jgi:hypothetical protein
MEEKLFLTRGCYNNANSWERLFSEQNMLVIDSID